MSKRSRREREIAQNQSAGMADVIPVNSEPAAAVAVAEPATEVVAESSVVEGAEVDASEVVIEDAPATVPAASGGSRQNATSIRKTIREGLLAGESTQTIAARLKELFPNSAAAAKSSKHIAFYKSLMRKAGELPKVGATK